MLIFALSHAIEDVHLACTNNLLIYFLATPASLFHNFHLPYKTLENRKTKNGSEYLDLPALTKPIYTRLLSRRVQERERGKGLESGGCHDSHEHENQHSTETTSHFHKIHDTALFPPLPPRPLPLPSPQT